VKRKPASRPTRTRRLSLAEIAEAYLADLSTRASPKSVEAVSLEFKRMQHELGIQSASEISVPLVMAWRHRRLAAGAAHKTANTAVGYLKAALAFAVLMGRLDTHPLDGLPALPSAGRHQRRRPRPFTDVELGRLFAAAQDLDARTRARGRRWVPQEPLLQALAHTGARWSELTSTVWGDLDLEHGVLTLREEITKTERARAIPIESGLLGLLAELPKLQERALGRAPSAVDLIFLAPRGRPWPANTAGFHRNVLAPCLSAAGIQRRDKLGRVVHVHAFRHTFASRLARAGVPIATTQALTGHATPALLLAVYTHVSNEDTRRAIATLPRITIPADPARS